MTGRETYTIFVIQANQPKDIKMNELLNKMITVNYRTTEGESESISGVLESYSEQKDTSIFRLSYPREGEQRATGISFGVSVGNFTVQEGEV